MNQNIEVQLKNVYQKVANRIVEQFNPLQIVEICLLSGNNRKLNDESTLIITLATVNV